VCAVCGTVWCGFWGSEFELCVVEFGVSLGEFILCCVWESFVSVWGSNYVLCLGQFGAGLGE